MSATVTERHRELARKALQRSGGWIPVIAHAIADAEERGRQEAHEEYEAVSEDMFAQGECPNPMCMEAFEGEHAMSCLYAAYILALLPEVKP